MKKRIKLKITKIAAKLCGDYTDIRKCLIATAAKRQFKTGSVTCAPGYIRIDRTGYVFGRTVEDKLLRCYVRRTTEEDFEPSKIRQDFRPFNIILTPL